MRTCASDVGAVGTGDRRSVGLCHQWWVRQRLWAQWWLRQRLWAPQPREVAANAGEMWFRCGPLKKGWSGWCVRPQEAAIAQGQMSRAIHLYPVLVVAR